MAGAPPILIPYVLVRILRADLPRRAPALAAAVAKGGDELAQAAFHDAAKDFELSSVPDAYGAMIYASPEYAARFGVKPPALPAADALVEAFGGPLDHSAPDLRDALRDALLDTEAVRRIAAALRVPRMLPRLEPDLPHLVEHFELDPAHVAMVIAEVASFYRRAAEAARWVAVRWHPNA
jgi:hypothetical protein